MRIKAVFLMDGNRLADGMAMLALKRALVLVSQLVNGRSFRMFGS
jgi:hypothetical protein